MKRRRNVTIIKGRFKKKNILNLNLTPERKVRTKGRRDDAYVICLRENLPPPEILFTCSVDLFSIYYILRNDLQLIICNEIRMQAQKSVSEICFSTLCEGRGVKVEHFQSRSEVGEMSKTNECGGMVQDKTLQSIHLNKGKHLMLIIC